MRSKITICAAIALAVSAFPAAAWERITTEEDFRAAIADRTITTAEGNSFTSHSDGRVTGTWGGQAMSGRWEWHQGFWCRNVRVGSTESGTDCQMVERRGNEVRNTRDQGRGAPGVGRLN
ncbi:MAG: hypothetical protein ACXIU8_04035 [Alkalilacustris sp.]